MRVCRVLLVRLSPLVAGLVLVGCTGRRAQAPAHHGTSTAADTSSAVTVSCCIRPSCDVCAEKFGRCTCLEDLKAGRPVCGQCIEGYKAGKGKLKLISIPEIKRREGT